MLMNLNLVDMSDNQYYLTKLGNEVYELLRMMETAIKVHRILDTTHILDMPGTASDEFDKLV